MPDIDPISAASSNVEDRRVCAEDVLMSYRLFLGREPDDPTVLQERAGQLASEMLNGFVNSDEFRNWAVQVVETSEPIARAFMKPAAAEIRTWAMCFFEFDADQAARADSARTLLELSSITLATSLLRRVIDTAHGDGEAARLCSSINDAAHRCAESMGSLETSAEDIVHLYHLILGRSPESESAAMRRDAPLYSVVSDFLSSSEFATKIVSAALAGGFGGARPLSPGTRKWMRSALGIHLGSRACRQEAIVALLQHEPIAERLRKARLVWSLPSVLEALMVEGADSEDPAQEEASLAALLEQSGLFDAAWYIDRNAEARQGGGPLRHFLDHGAYEGRDPGPNFDTTYYLAQNPDAAASRLLPVEHYLRIGLGRGVPAKGSSPYVGWVERFDDLTASDCERIAEDAASARLPSVTGFQVFHADNPPNRGGKVEHAAQIGVKLHMRYVGGGAAAPSGDPLDRLADGDIVVIIAEPCRLRPHACYMFAKVLTDGALTIAYSDHDHLVAGNHRERPIFKPAMSPDFMRQVAYAGPVVAVRLHGDNRARTALAIAQAAAGNGLAAVAELLLAEAHGKVGHIPFVLFSIPSDPNVEGPPAPFSYEPVPSVALSPAATSPLIAPKVCILIPSRDHRDILSACVDSIFAKTRYPADHFEVVVIDNETREAGSIAYLQELADRPRCRVIASPGPFNFAKICNDGALEATAEILVFLNNDMTVLDPEWLTRLVAEAVRPEIGVVGAQLLYPDDTVQHGGVIVGVRGFGAHRLAGVPAQTAARFDVTREMTTMTGACIAIRNGVFKQVGGFDPVLGVAFNDVALCMRVVQAGYRNLYIGHALLYHHESRSRGRDDSPAKVRRNLREAIYTRERFRQFFQNDVLYSPNLSLQETGALAFPPRVVRPWRRAPKGHVLILLGDYGVAASVTKVVAAQAKYFLNLGWIVTIGLQVAVELFADLGCHIAILMTGADAAEFALTEGVDCIIAHTPPFFSVARFLGRRPLFYIHDHGPLLRPSPLDPQAMEDAAWDKRFHAPFAERVFTTSQTVYDQQYRRDAIVVHNGNDDLATVSPEWTMRRVGLRRRHGFHGYFIVLGWTQHGDPAQCCDVAELYKELAAEFRYAAPNPVTPVKFVLITTGSTFGQDPFEDTDLTVIPNCSEDVRNAMFAAADLYVSLQDGSGYDPGLAQAAAMGLGAIASDSAAHRETAVITAASVPRFCHLIEEASRRWSDTANDRWATVARWHDVLSQQVSLIVADVAADNNRAWL